MIKEAISTLVAGEDLTPETMKQVMEEIMTGEATDAQKASFLTALAIKGETIEEITEAAKVMRSHCAPFDNDMDTLEIVGTGGDRSNTINISTLAALITSAAGIKTTKHGNRAASSKCGTADCLEALGVKIDGDAEESLQSLRDNNFCFLFAQKYHPAMRFVGAVRREIGIRTMFNILGPLANPAKANMQLMGVYDGMDCIDEISLSAPTKVCEYRDGKYKTYEITPEQFGFTRCEKSNLVGGEPQENAQIVRDILGGAKGPKTDVVLLNAGAAIYTATEGITFEEGIAKAKEVLESGAALEQLQKLTAK